MSLELIAIGAQRRDMLFDSIKANASKRQDLLFDLFKESHTEASARQVRANSSSGAIS